MNDTLDLDVLNPQPKKVKINGEVVMCNPPKVLQLIKLQQVFNKLQGVTKSEEVVAVTEELESLLAQIIPDLVEKHIDLSMEQMVALFTFLQSSAIPDQYKQIDVGDDSKKKDNLNSADQLPTS